MMRMTGMETDLNITSSTAPMARIEASFTVVESTDVTALMSA